MSRSEPVDGGAVPRVRARSPMRPPDPACEWTAEIAWGRRDGEPGFSVCARRAGAAATVALAESPPLDWPPSGPDSVAALTSAVRMLEASLLAAGWRSAGSGGSWYAKQFEWRAAGDARETDPPRLRLVTPAPPEVPPEPLPDAELAPPGGPFARTPPWPEGSRELWRCEIDWRAGWSESRFEAVMYRPRGRRGRAIGGSSPAKWLLMRQPDADAPEMRVAVQRLAGSLVAAGWSPAGTGLGWYSQRFVWRREGTPPDHVQPVVPGQDAGN
jgi:hypothetical protein